MRSWVGGGWRQAGEAGHAVPERVDDEQRRRSKASRWPVGAPGVGPDLGQGAGQGGGVAAVLRAGGEGVGCGLGERYSRGMGMSMRAASSPTIW